MPKSMGSVSNLRDKKQTTRKDILLAWKADYNIIRVKKKGDKEPVL